MEDEGQVADHTAGISATDGAWHHIAVTWRSSDGATALYDNGRKASALLGSGTFPLWHALTAWSSYPRQQWVILSYSPWQGAGISNGGP